MQIFRSMKSDWITQKFGKENTASSMLEEYKKLGLDGHNGWDFAVFGCSMGLEDNPQNKCEPIYYDVSVRGIASDLVNDEKAGVGIKVITEDINGIFKHIWWHEHSLDPVIKKGDILETGALLGWGGTTGLSTGPHVHRGLKPLAKDPYGNYYKLYPNNGYDGAIDLMPFFKNVFVLDEMERLRKVLDNLQQQVSIWQKIINILKLWKTLLFL